MTFNEEILELLNNAKRQLKMAVNISMVYTYYEIGKRIVKEEQNGNNRAGYGKHILSELSAYLTENFGKGFSVGNLKNIRQFYRIYSTDTIGETVFSQFENLPATDNNRKFYLSWSHYLKLMRIDNIDERHFCKYETVLPSKEELQRLMQVDD